MCAGRTSCERSPHHVRLSDVTTSLRLSCSNWLFFWPRRKTLRSSWRQTPTPTAWPWRRDQKGNALRAAAWCRRWERTLTCVCASRCGWKVFTGNEMAALLGWWMFFNWKEAHPDAAHSEKVFMLATTVSSKILAALARTEGFQFEVRTDRLRSR